MNAPNGRRGIIRPRPKRKVPLRLKAIRALMSLGYVAPKSVARLAHAVFITPRGPRTVPKSALFDRAKKVSTRFQGHQLRGYLWGKGPCILLVHGWQSRAFDMKHFVEPFLSRGYSVIAFDGLSHGLSEGRLASFADSCKATQQIVEEVNPHGIVAHSYGAAAVVYSLAQSEQALTVRKIAVIAPIAETTQVVDNFIRVAGVPRRVWPHFDAEIKRTWGRPKEFFSTVTFAGSIRIPALMFHDRLDLVVPYSGGERVAKRLAAVDFITTSGLGHSALLKDPSTRMSVEIFFGSAVEEHGAAKGVVQ